MGVSKFMIYLLILTNITLRLLSHLPNFTSMSATALFAGAKLTKKQAFLIPILSLLVSDYLLLYIHPFSEPTITLNHIYSITNLIHTTTPYVWSSFIISSLIGSYLKKHHDFLSVTSSCCLTSIQFFIITNFGVWATGMYDRNISGLIESYISGLPFFKFSLLGDLFYTYTLFSLFALAQKTNLKLLIRFFGRIF